MIEKIKPIPFIDESNAVKLTSLGGKLVLERTDRVLWAREKTQVDYVGQDCYVEASKFFVLLPEIKTLVVGTCLEVVLKNNAKYSLPFLEVQWESRVMPEGTPQVIRYDIEPLIVSTLSNLIKPELQCIYIDNQGAVSCDFISACFSPQLKSDIPFLLPADVQKLVLGDTCKTVVTDSQVGFMTDQYEIIVSVVLLGEDRWWEQLRDMMKGVSEFYSTTGLDSVMKRMALFVDYVSFDGSSVCGGTNKEPYQFHSLEGKIYEVSKLSALLDYVKEMTVANDALVLKGEKVSYMLSPLEEA